MISTVEIGEPEKEKSVDYHHWSSKDLQEASHDGCGHHHCQAQTETVERIHHNPFISLL